MNSFYTRCKLMAGNNALDNLIHELKMRNIMRPMIICDKIDSYPSFVKPVLKAFDNDKIKPGNITFVSDDYAKAEVIDNLIETYKESGADSIIAVGRDVCISIAKLVRLSISEEAKSVKDISKISTNCESIPLIIVPIFIGSGLEGSKFARYYNAGDCINVSSEALLPDIIVADNKMLFRPSSTIIATGIVFSLGMSIQAYTDKAGNSVTQAAAMAAIRLIFDGVSKIKNGYRFSSISENFTIATVLSGIANNNLIADKLSNMANIVSKYMRLPFDKVYSMLFPHYYEVTLDKENDRYMDVLLPIVGEERYAFTAINSRAVAVYKEIRQLIDYLRDKTGFRYNLSDYKLARTDIDKLVGLMVKENIDENMARVILERTY